VSERALELFDARLVTAGVTLELLVVGDDDRFDVLELRAAATLRPSPAVPATLAPAPDLADDPVAATREVRLSGSQTNFGAMDMSRVDIAATLDTTEEWRVRNADGQPHNFHVHDVQFQVVRLGGASPPPVLAGWKDTVLLRPGQTAELRMRFTDHSDPGSPYMFHCHLLRHEDQGMMGQFVVVRPGEQVRGLHVEGRDGAHAGSNPPVTRVELTRTKDATTGRHTH